VIDLQDRMDGSPEYKEDMFASKSTCRQDGFLEENSSDTECIVRHFGAVLFVSATPFS
jgi:hypothetical protein